VSVPEPNCERTIKQSHAAFPDGFADRIHSAKITSIRITGDTAVVQLSMSADETPIEKLRRIDDQWLVE